MVREADPSCSSAPAPSNAEPAPALSKAEPAPGLGNEGLGGQERAPLRRRLLDARARMTADARANQVHALAPRLDELVGRLRGASTLGVLGVYWPIRGEPDLRELYSAWHQRGAILALPVVAESAAPLRFRRWAPGDAMQKDRQGVPVPVGGEWVVPQLMVVPCVGFDPRGYRLGYGGGYYDRTLAELPVAALGVAWSESGFTGFEPHASDLPMDAIVTADRLWGRLA